MLFGQLTAQKLCKNFVSFFCTQWAPIFCPIAKIAWPSISCRCFLITICKLINVGDDTYWASTLQRSKSEPSSIRFNFRAGIYQVVHLIADRRQKTCLRSYSVGFFWQPLHLTISLLLEGPLTTVLLKL